MDRPDVKKGDWISIGSNHISGYVIDVFLDGGLGVGYSQNNAKAIKDDVDWDGERWQFRYSGPSGSYLSGPVEFIVMRGPQPKP